MFSIVLLVGYFQMLQKGACSKNIDRKAITKQSSMRYSLVLLNSILNSFVSTYRWRPIASSQKIRFCPNKITVFSWSWVAMPVMVASLVQNRMPQPFTPALACCYSLINGPRSFRDDYGPRGLLNSKAYRLGRWKTSETR